MDAELLCTIPLFAMMIPLRGGNKQNNEALKPLNSVCPKSIVIPWRSFPRKRDRVTPAFTLTKQLRTRKSILFPGFFRLDTRLRGYDIVKTWVFGQTLNRK